MTQLSPTHSALLAALLGECCERPSDVEIRGIYFDAAAETGEPGLVAQAELFQTQVELEKCGPERILLGGEMDWFNRDDNDRYRCHLESYGGPDYYEATSALSSPVGSRVDVQCGFLKNGRWKTKIVHGLLVRKVKAENVFTYTLKRDELSVPWAGQELRRRECELLMAYWHRWVFRDHPHCAYCDNILMKRPEVDYSKSLLWRFHLGFPDNVTMPMEAWAGRTCERCGGQDHTRDSGPTAGFALCPACSGSGRADAAGPSLVRASPIASVRFSGWEPYFSHYIFTGTGKPEWSICDAPIEDRTSHVGPLIFQHLKGGNPRPNTHWRGYDSEQAALDALSNASIRWARKVAGLSPLSETQP